MYDRQEVYDKHIKKKANELNELCKSLGIASFMSFCTYGSEKSTEYHNFINGSSSNGIYLSDDQITKHVNVANGFLTVPPDGRNDFDNEDAGDEEFEM